jgi:hypothetical protein
VTRLLRLLRLRLRLLRLRLRLLRAALKPLSLTSSRRLQLCSW